MGWWTKFVRLFLIAVISIALPAAMLGCSSGNSGSNPPGGDAAADGEVDGAVDSGQDTSTPIEASTDSGVKNDGGEAGVKTLTSVQVAPATASIAKGSTQQFTATANYSDGSTQDVTNTATWSSSDMTIAGISSSGLATGVKAGGPVTITAKVTTGAGSPKSGTATLTVTAATLTTISVTPAAPSIAVGLTQQFTATGVYSDNSVQDITASVTWTSGTVTKATIDAAGLATGVAAGTSTITAALSGKSGTATLTVTSATLNSIQVTPAAGTTNIGGATVQFTATAYYSNGLNSDVTTSAAWTSSATSVATIGAATGLATPVAVGTTTITATFGGKNGTATLIVGNATVTSIVVTPSSPSIPAGLTQQFTATANLSNGTQQNVTSLAAWQSSTLATATISATGLATGVAAGTSTITATYSGFSGTALLTVNNATVNSITVTPNPGNTNVGGATVQFTATAALSNGTNLVVTTSATWTSSVTTDASIGAATGLATPAATGSGGTTIITATYGGKSGTATLVVGSATLQSITVTAPTYSIAAGTDDQFTATGNYSDGTQQNLTLSASWQSSTPATATVGSGTGLAHGVAAGTTTITATFGGKSGSATLTVTTATLVSISISPSTPQSLPKGNTVTFVATGTYSDTSTQNITALVTWGSAPSGVVVFTGAVAQGTAVGTTQVTAVSGAITSNATTVNVTAATLVSIAVTPSAPANLHVGAKQAFTATGTYSDTTTADLTSSANWASGSSATATITTGGAGAGVATGVAGGTTNITATVGAIVSSPPVVLTVSGATLVTIAVTPSSAQLAVGGTQPFTATGTYSDTTTANITSTVTWSSTTNSGAATGDFSVAAGLVTGVSSTVSDAAMTAANGFPAGQGLVKAAQGAISGVAQVKVTSSTITGIAVTCRSLKTNFFGVSSASDLSCIPSGLGFEVSCTALATYSDLTTGDVTGTANWASTTTSVATLGALSNGKQYFNIVGNGNTTATAALGGQTGTSATIQGAAETIVATGYGGFCDGGAFGVWVPGGSSCIAASVNAGLNQQLEAVAIFTGACSGGSEYLDITTLATWTSSNGTVASVSNAAGSVGLATAISPGSSTISASWQSGTGSIGLNVPTACLQSLSIDQANATYPADVYAPLTAKAVFSNSPNPVQLTVGDPNYSWTGGTVDSASWILDTSVAVTNPLTIHAGFAGCGGATITGTTSITIDSTTLPNGLTITPATSTIGLGGSVDYTATASYPTYGSFNVARQSAWTTNPVSGALVFTPDALPNLNEKMQHSGTTSGSFTVQALYRNQAALASLTVNATRTVTGITVSSAGVGAPTTKPYNGTGVPVGLPVTFGVTVSYSDGTTSPSLTGVSFNSSTAGVLNLSANVGTTAAVGSTNVTAQIAGCGGTCTSPNYAVVVDNATITSMGFSPGTPVTIPKNTVEALAITANYSDGSSYDVSSLVTSSSANSAVVAVSTTATGTTFSSFGTTTTSAITLTILKDGKSALFNVNVSGTQCVTGLSLSPASVASLPEGATQLFTATGTYNDGTQFNATGTASWGIGSGTTLTNNGGGSYTASTTASGSNAITATLTGASVCNGGNLGNNTITASAPVTVTSASVIGLTVAFAGVSGGQLPLGESRQLVVTGLFSDGSSAPVTSSCTFTAVASTIASTNATGLVTGAGLGTAAINVVYTPNGTLGSINVTVSNCGSPAVTISGPAGNIAIGQTENFTAQATYTGGGSCTASGAQLVFNTTATGSWNSSNTTAATISNTSPNNGLLSAVAVGTTNITQTYKTVTSNTIVVTPIAVTLTSLVAAGGASVANGQTETVTVTPTWSDGGHYGVSISWSISDPTEVSIGATTCTLGVCSATLTGLAVTASPVSYFATANSVASNTLQVSVTSACVNGVTLSSSNGTTLPAGVPTIVSYACTMSDGSACTATPAFADDGVVIQSFGSVGNQFIVAAAGPGTVTATIAATGTCPQVQKVLDITGGTATLASIALTPVSANIPKNTTQAYTSQGTYAGGTGGGTYNVSALAGLSSTDNAVAAPVGLPTDLTKPSLVLAGITAGTVSITSNYQSVTSNVGSLTVNTTKVLQSILVQSDASSTALCPTVASPCTTATSAAYPAGGYDLQLHAYGTYNDGSSAGEITSSVTWSLATPIVTGTSLSAGGLLTTGTVAGTQNVTASQASVTSLAFGIAIDANNIASVSIKSPTDGSPVTSLPNGAGATYEAVAATSSGAYWVTGNFTWASSNPAVGTIVATGAGAGQYTAVATSGTTNVTATRGALTGGPLVVTDSAATPVSIACSPATLTVQPGSNAQLTATVTFSDSTQVDETSSALTGWTLSNPAIGSVSTTAGSRGEFTAVNTAGTSTVTATYPGAAAGLTCSITVP